MRIFSASSFMAKKDWQLAAAIVSIYLPIRIFLSNNYFNLDVLLSKAPLWTVEVLLNLLFFRAWIIVVEAIQRLFDWLDSSLRLRFARRLFTYAIGLFFAIVFNLGFIMVWYNMSEILRTRLNITIHRTAQERSPFNRQQQTKSNTALTIMAMLTTIYMVSSRRSNQRLQEVSMTAERLEKENLQARFQALKSQLSPHFLFNSLSILTSLIEKDPQKSVLYVNRLSKSYRYILDHSDLESVSLKTELDFVETYIFLLKSRFEDKVQVDIKVPDSVHHQYKIAPLTLQLLIENAVKHNQMSQENPVRISIELCGLYLVVSNPIKKRRTEPQSVEIGLANIVRRYSLLTTEPVLISSADAIFTVKIPLLL